MIDYRKELVKALNEILPTYYELFVDSATQTPCITYRENNNHSIAEGDTLRYSQISFIIKIWGNDIDDIAQYANLIDLKMKKLGFRRVSANELSHDTQIEKIFIYEAFGKENLQ